MAYVPVRTDESKHSWVDGKSAGGYSDSDADFDTPVQLSASGFGIQRVDPRSGKIFFEVLDAFAAGQQSVQVAIEDGSSSAAASQGGVTAVNFASVDELTQAEANASNGGIKDSLVSPGDQT